MKTYNISTNSPCVVVTAVVAAGVVVAVAAGVVALVPGGRVEVLWGDSEVPWREGEDR